MDRTYVLGVLRAASAETLARGAVRKLVRGLRRPPPAPRTTGRPRALRRLGLFTDADATTLRTMYEKVGDDALDRAIAAAEDAEAGHCIVFGRSVALAGNSGRPDFDLDVLSGRPWNGEEGAPLVDPKGVWEPAKLPQVGHLAVAARLDPSSAPRRLRALVALVAAFRDQTRLAGGPHWKSPLEVALRSVQLVAAWDLAGAEAPWPAGAAGVMAEAIASHGEWLEGRIEDGGLVLGTHALGDLCGLLFTRAGAVAHDAPSVPGDDGLFVRFQGQAERQIGADGLDQEGSTSYHRFALEIVLAVLLWRRATHGGMDGRLAWLLRRMLVAQRDLTLADGSDPGIGDSDDARVLPLVPRENGDRRYLLSLGATLLDDASLKMPDARPCEEAVLLCGPAGIARFERLPPLGRPWSRSYPNAGFHVLRAGGTELVVRAGSYGQSGVGGHAHNDQLSFVLHCRKSGRVVVDPGTFTYCGAPAHRDRFRSTASHATLTVDGAEQSPLPDRAFALPDRAGGRVVAFQVAEGTIACEHRGYRRLSVEHRRRFDLAANGRALLITDVLSGRGRHDLVRTLPLPASEQWPIILPAGAGGEHRAELAALDPRADVPSELPVAAALALGPSTGRPLLLVFSSHLGEQPTVRIERGWVSSAYGAREPAPVIRVSESLQLPATLRLALLLP